MSAFPPLAIANEVLLEARRQGKSLTVMQLLKLVYISHGWSLGLLGSPLVDESAQAWQHGPVFPALYREFRRFGSQEISDLARNRLGADYRADLAANQREIIRSVVANYGDMHAFRLSAMTHQADTPWSETYRGGAGKDDEIPDNVIRQHYQKLARERVAVA